MTNGNNTAIDLTIFPLLKDENTFTVQHGGKEFWLDTGKLIVFVYDRSSSWPTNVVPVSPDLFTSLAGETAETIAITLSKLWDEYPENIREPNNVLWQES